MQKVRLIMAAFLLCALSTSMNSFALGSDTDKNNASEEPKSAVAKPAKMAKPAKRAKFYDYKGYGVQFNASTLGFGGDFAVGLTKRSNVRVGANFFNYSRTFENDGVSYDGTLGLKSVQTTYDFFPFAGGFHLSPGLLLYNGTQLKANASVGPNNTFTVNDVDYVSRSDNLLTGTGKMTMNKVAPVFLFGLGNMIPRSGRHVTFKFEAGVVFQGSPKVNLNFKGGVCPVDPNTGLTLPCVDAATQPDFLTNVAEQQKKISDDAKPFKYYPVISFGIGYRFGGAKK